MDLTLDRGKTKEETRMSNKEKRLNFTSNQGMQTQTTIKYHYIR